MNKNGSMAYPTWARRSLVTGFFFLLLFIWHFAVRLMDVSPLIFPEPWNVARSLYFGFRTGEFLPHLAVTLHAILAGFGLGAFAGFLLGVVIAQSRLIEMVIYPYVVAFQTMPKVAIAPLFVVWFGFGVASKIIITATIVFFPVLANTIVGLRSAPRDQIDLMTAFTASRWQILWMVRLPQSLPYVFAGLDIGIVLAVIGAIVGEFVGAQAGLGYLILQRNFSLDTAGVFAVLIVLSVIGIGLHAITKLLARKVTFWSESFIE
jgi:NitT/TauT family transport system permease protein